MRKSQNDTSGGASSITYKCQSKIPKQIQRFLLFPFFNFIPFIPCLATSSTTVLAGLLLSTTAPADDCSCYHSCQQLLLLIAADDLLSLHLRNPHCLPKHVLALESPLHSSSCIVHWMDIFCIDSFFFCKHQITPLFSINLYPSFIFDCFNIRKEGFRKSYFAKLV